MLHAKPAAGRTPTLGWAGSLDLLWAGSLLHDGSCNEAVSFSVQGLQVQVQQVCGTAAMSVASSEEFYFLPCMHGQQQQAVLPQHVGCFGAACAYTGGGGDRGSG
jgi:hypothetical protein